jgi:Na+-transporting NADH:ubiquinone oxidoreductase subunit C
MKNYSNSYVLVYSAVLLGAAALLLSIVAVALRPKQQHNEAIEQKQMILRTAGIACSAAETEAVYADNISLVALGPDSTLPAYRYGDKHIIALHGKGLWGPIWGYMCFDKDWTVCGAVFDHKGETPGLGGNISTEEFASQFIGKSCIDSIGFDPIVLKKRARRESRHEVDAISGGTMTSNGVSAMLRECLEPYKEVMLQSLQAKSTDNPQ